MVAKDGLAVLCDIQTRRGGLVEWDAWRVVRKVNGGRENAQTEIPIDINERRYVCEHVQELGGEDEGSLGGMRTEVFKALMGHTGIAVP